MNRHLKLNIKTPTEQIGSSKYTLQLEITNLADSSVYLDEIDPDIIPGIVISKNQTETASEIDSLEFEKKEIVEEIEMQLARAYDRQKFRILNPFAKAIFIYASMPEIIAASLTKTKPNLTFPNWAKKAFTVKEWDDVIQLEETIMSSEKEDSLLRKAFNINKIKLEKILQKISEVKNAKDVKLGYSYTLNSKETINIPFHCRAPHLYKGKEFDILFNLKFRVDGSDNVFNQSTSERIKFKPSSFATPLGAGLGGILGFFVRLIFVTKGAWFDSQFWTVLFGSLILAIVFGLFMNNSTESKKIISVEGFVGGIILGSIAGLFTENIIEYFENFLPGKSA
ncbi:MAG: hypothetical protein HYZ14_17540 [Bacteroidetes bacterium]|nr:hypothetical protein [Bacteroidota bacterium]